MSGNILIVDGLATNRIVLKVKLSAAYFSVGQASSAAEALTMVDNDKPQAVLIADDLPDATASQLIGRIRTKPGCDRLPVLILTATNAQETRLALLAAGANDVIAKPVNEQVLLARLRSLSRQAPAETDLDINIDTAEALGFAEAQGHFTTRGLIGALHASMPQAQTLWRILAKGTPHRFEVFQMGRTGTLNGLTAAPDVLLVSLPEGTTEQGLVKLAELSSAPQTRQARLLVLLDAADAALAAKVLDMGAHDVAAMNAHPREIFLRLDALLRAKQADDVQKARLRTGLHAAVTDPLTGLYNRRYALSQMARMIENARTDQQSFAVMVADLDHFKSVNDTYGHAAGDQVLTRISHSLRDALRPADTLSRIGGEEFLILMPQSGKKDVHTMAEHLCRTVRETAIALPGVDMPLSLTISIGATVAHPASRGDVLVPETLLAEADHALYAAKSDGRDTVTISHLSAA